MSLPRGCAVAAMVCAMGGILSASSLCAADVLKTQEDGGPGVFTDGKAAK